MLKEEVSILIAEDDMGHATLIMRNLRRAGIMNPITHFKDGREILDFLYSPEIRSAKNSYLLVLDIRMPRVDGVEVLRTLKQDPEYKKIPVMMLSTTDDPREIDECHRLGCSSYISKPVEYDRFVQAINTLGLFLMIVKVPQIEVHEVKP